MAKARVKHPYRLVTVTVVAACLVIGGVLIYKHFNNPASVNTTSASKVRPTNSVSYSAAPSADNNANNERKSSSSPAQTLNNGSVSQTSSSPTYSIQITNATVSNNNLHVGDVVSGITSGSCTLTASQTGQSTIQLATSSVHQDVNYYDCGVFNIATSTFPTSGSWNVTLTVIYNGESASNSASINIGS